MYRTADEDALRARIAKESGNSDVRVWKCPCEMPECVTRVYYARTGDDHEHPRHVLFEPNVGFTQYEFRFGIGNVEDLELWIRDETLDPTDRLMYAMWLNLGLREALLNAPERGAGDADRG